LITRGAIESARAGRLALRCLVLLATAGGGTNSFSAESDTAADAPAVTDTAAAASTELTMIDAIDRALSHNFALLAGAQDVVIGAADVGLARSELLPHVDASLHGSEIDSDRAVAAIGQAPEYQSFASVSLRQRLYSDKALSAYDVQRMLEASRVKDQEARVLDTILATAVAYLNLLRAEALLEVDRKNLNVTEANYQRASSRLELGVGTRSEIYRWETARANAQSNVVTAEATAHQARIVLNRTMSEPLGNQYSTETPSLDAAYFMVSSPEIRAELRRPGSRVLLRRYFLDETLRGAPEIKAMQQRIDAQGRRLTTAKRAFYLPELSAQAGLDQELGRGGQGTEQADFSKLFPGAPGGVTDKTNWIVGVEARLPLYQGGARSADRDRAQAELDQEQLRYDDLVLSLQSGVLQQTLSTEARFDRIGYSNTAATAGHNNLELVTEAYERGVMTVTDLVDAQFSAFNADQEAANAVYDFLIDYLRLQRYTGRFDIVATDAERAAMKERLQAALVR
jgi:outer membrane protein TolC